MAMLKIQINEDTNKVRFDNLKEGEIFLMDDVTKKTVPHIKAQGSQAVNLANGNIWHLSDESLVTYVQNAALKVTV